MSKIEKFEELKVWQKAREICNLIEELFQLTKLGKNFALRDQMERSSGSIMDNIAEGFGRNGNREFHNFLSYSKGSCAELKSQIYRCFDKKLINEEQFQKLIESTEEEINKIGAFMYYLRNSGIKGQKFK
jgi:four helix bundle protein